MNYCFENSNSCAVNTYGFVGTDYISLFCAQPIVIEATAPVFTQQLLNQYCLCTQDACDDRKVDTLSTIDITKRGTVKPKGNKVLMLKKSNLPLRANELLSDIQSIKFGEMILIAGKKKAESKVGPLSSKRSSFIGVSRNGPHWQALITINKKKTYIGSYKTEVDAAVAFDFYSILLHYFGAKTNCSYTKDNIVEMIWNFKKNGSILKPEYLSFI